MGESKLLMSVSQVEKNPLYFHLHKSPLAKHTMKVSLKRNKHLKCYRLGGIRNMSQQAEKKNDGN